MDAEVIDRLMPVHTRPAERALALGVAQSLDLPVDVDQVWNPATAPAAVLPFLAWALSVDEWDARWPEERRREIIARSIELHRIKGTRGAIDLVLEMLGYGDAVVIEDRDWPRFGAESFFGGRVIFGEPGLKWGPSDPHWADFWVNVQSPVTIDDVVRLAARIIEVSPVRSRLRAVTMVGVVYVYGASGLVYGAPVTFGGVYEFGGSNG